MSAKTIGIFGSLQEISYRTLQGMLRYTRENAGLVIRDFRLPHRALAEHPVPPFWKGKADGLILNVGRYFGDTDRETANWLLSGEAALVSVTHDWSDARIPQICVDHRSLGRVAAAHLVECGCQSYLFVGLQAPSTTASRVRSGAFARALKQQGKTLQRVDLLSPLYGLPEDVQLIRKEKELVHCLRRLKKPVGIWTLNDIFARAVCHLCEFLNLRVPDDVKVLGVDDLVTSRTELPSLSTIHTPREEVGYLATKVLHDLMRGMKCPHTTLVRATELVVRDSTADGARAELTLAEAVAYIARHACNDLTVPHLAERMGMSQRSFENKFRRLVGHLPRDEIKRVRLERAKELLVFTELSIRTVTEAIGFQESSDFCSFFRKEVGLSPLEYRATVPP